MDETNKVSDTGNRENHVAAGAENTSGFLQMGFWGLKGGCGGIFEKE